VAAGDLGPEEAGRLLDVAPAAPTIDRGSLGDRDPSSADRGELRALVIRAGGVKLTVVADPTVDTMVGVGPHSVRRDGDLLVLDAPRAEGYQTQPAPRFLGWVPTTWTAGRGEKVTVRVNPLLPITVEATASGVEIIGIHADLTLSGNASSVKVRDHRGTVHGNLAMCSVSVAGVITGPSDLTCELGSVNVRLAPGSDVELVASSEMGSVKVAGATAGVARGDDFMRQALTVGAGTHPFDLLVRMGSASVVSG
jgi:hypothetical protein